MIGSVSNLSAAFPPRLAELNQASATVRPDQSAAAQIALAPSALASTREVPGLATVTPSTQAPGASFGDVLSQAVSGVNATMQNAEVQKAKVMSGETNNLHQAMLSIQEAGVAFSLMTEVRNKMVESYQEIMRMQV